MTSRSLILFFFYCSGDHRDLHSFPTRRSSDLAAGPDPTSIAGTGTTGFFSRPLPAYFKRSARRRRNAGKRSEEHTSELQSLRHLVCRLLLEKKKKKK